MQEELIKFHTAKLAKEKRFDICTNSFYFEDGEFREHSLTGTNGYYGDPYEFKLNDFNENWNDKLMTNKNGDRCFGCDKSRGYFETFSAPTQSLLQKWLREEHNIFAYCLPCEHNKGWYWQITIFPEDCITDFELEKNKSYEQALEDGLFEALKLI